MSRSLKKGPFVDEKLLARIADLNRRNEKAVLKTWSRGSTVFPEMVGHTIAVHDAHIPQPRGKAGQGEAGTPQVGQGRTGWRRKRAPST
jgi:hypothetical protein